ncbi:MAG TPA: C25 family cysteine peptidase, partial [Bacteroidia bacterium]|nr:C25 family cysteine peptidase [Bacteroidia bacterium]
SASASTVSSAVNGGLSLINYCGHGANNQFVTSGFSTSNVNSLTNGDKLPFIFSVACVNGEFHTTTCFAEAWLRKVNGGAVATIMSTINQPWVEPMIAQDYMNDLLTGGYTYQNNTTAPGKGTNTDHGKTHFGSITFNGECLMLAELNNTSSQETIQTWTIFGDPSLQVRTDEAKPLVVSNANVTAGSYVTNISVNGAPFANALVSIWDGANQPFSALTDANGNVTISHTLATGTNATLTVTGFNLIPFIKTVAISTGTSVPNDNIVSALNIYPNPSNGEFNLSYSLVNNENASIKVLDVTGKVIYTDVLKQNVQSKRIALNNVENGIYFLQFQNNSGTVTKKLNIQK